jgi:transposase
VGVRPECGRVSTAPGTTKALKIGVTLAHRYEPEIHRTYAELARHYGCGPDPRACRHAHRQPKVEVSVQIAERWILAALGHRTFFTLADLNAAIK